MNIHELKQGTPEWLALRASYNCASEAPAMMGASPRTKRNDLLHMKATGNEKEFSAWAQANLLERGHEVEVFARARVEEMIGEELYPVTGSDDGDLNLLASFDGVTMSGDTGFECKLWNRDLVAAMEAGDVPPMHHWQLEQQILVGGLTRIIFVCTDGTAENFRHLEYRAVPGRAAQLVAGWKQFDEDVKNYSHVEVIPAPRGNVIRDFPALIVQLRGEVENSNLALYRETALRYIAGINTDLQTDQDFADAEENVKFCSNAEGRLEEVKSQALAQTASIDELFRTLDQLREAMRGKRLDLSKLVAARKESIRADILRGGQTKLAEHVAAMNARLGHPYMPTIPADFAGAMKGKKTIASLRDAVDTELARAKIEANAIADKIDANLKVLAQHAGEHMFLFSDVAQIVHKASDDFSMTVKVRISDHKAAEEKRLAEQREKIRQEEEAKATAKAAATAPAVPAVALVAPAIAPQPAPLGRGKRPTDAAIVALVAEHWKTTTETATKWLLDLDLKPAKMIAGSRK